MNAFLPLKWPRDRISIKPKTYQKWDRGPVTIRNRIVGENAPCLAQPSSDILKPNHLDPDCN